ncbi:hypothetical protein JOD02_001236 [Caldicoprobacter guelmensis]|uniref:hypothetical protein n=1 Tax=Caldicoprobacter guelmensis TaxID=1170224 RepID=UPI00195C98BC|nr:hypothetical protein [Caldicoprobacter guelmensis]MBM7582379.1 hypothetical protein [Caldicoprobacter guelmensis]
MCSLEDEASTYAAKTSRYLNATGSSLIRMNILENCLDRVATPRTRATSISTTSI